MEMLEWWVNSEIFEDLLDMIVFQKPLEKTDIWLHLSFLVDDLDVLIFHNCSEPR